MIFRGKTAYFRRMSGFANMTGSVFNTGTEIRIGTAIFPNPRKKRVDRAETGL